MSDLISDNELEVALASRPAPRVTAEGMKDRIERVDYHVLPGSTVTICNITVNNGFSVRGESACVDPENFDEAIGRKIAFDNAFRQLWPLFGFLLAEDICRHRLAQRRDSGE